MIASNLLIALLTNGQIATNEEAVRSFVKVEQYFPVVSKKWIEASLDRI